VVLRVDVESSRVYASVPSRRRPQVRNSQLCLPHSTYLYDCMQHKEDGSVKR